MRALLFFSHQNSYRFKRFYDEAVALGWQVFPLFAGAVEVKNNSVWVEGLPVPAADIVLTAVNGYKDTIWPAVNLLQAQGAMLADNCTLHHSKWQQHSLLQQVGVLVPQTCFAPNAEAVHAIEQFVVLQQQKFPLVVKNIYGAKGEQVWLAENKHQLWQRLHSLWQQAEQALVQEAVYPLGSDVRAFVLGGQVVAAMARQAPAGQFHANFSRGAQVYVTTLTPTETEAVLRAASIYPAMHVAGVDFIRTERGPVFLEVNKVPGFEGMEKATGQNIARQMLLYFQGVAAQSQNSIDSIRAG